jgi:hypothetical protein
MLMPQDLSDLGKRSASMQHIGGKAMTEQACSLEAWSESHTRQRSSNDIAHGGRAVKALSWSLHFYENPA